MVLDRTLEFSDSEGTDYKNDERAVRVNVYGSGGSVKEEVKVAYDGVRNLLRDLYFHEEDNTAHADNGALAGYDIYGYTTDAHISANPDLSKSQHKQLIDDGMNAIKGTPHEDEHAIVLWVYWDHPSDITNCGPSDSTPSCPPYFMMGFDINCSSGKYVHSYHRQPYKHVAESRTSVCDILQGFVYVNTQDKPKEDWKKDGMAHEVGHALVTMDDSDVRDMAPSDLKGRHPDHYIGTKETSTNTITGETTEYNTVMGGPGRTVETGECSANEAASIRQINPSNCYFDAVNLSIDYFRDNTTIHSSTESESCCNF